MVNSPILESDFVVFEESHGIIADCSRAIHEEDFVGAVNLISMNMAVEDIAHIQSLKESKSLRPASHSNCI